MLEGIQLSKIMLQELEALLASISSDPSVKSIILFGSTARGTRNESSDVDLLVLVDNEESEPARIASTIRQQAFGLVSFPLDLIVENMHDYLDRAVLPTLERKIAREGKVLYAA